MNDSQPTLDDLLRAEGIPPARDRFAHLTLEHLYDKIDWMQLDIKRANDRESALCDALHRAVARMTPFPPERRRWFRR